MDEACMYKALTNARPTSVLKVCLGQRRPDEMDSNRGLFREERQVFLSRMPISGGISRVRCEKASRILGRNEMCLGPHKSHAACGYYGLRICIWMNKWHRERWRFSTGMSPPCLTVCNHVGIRNSTSCHRFSSPSLCGKQQAPSLRCTGLCPGVSAPPACHSDNTDTDNMEDYR